MNEQSKLAGRRAVVIGASMAGLLTARVLADYYERVTLLERDVFPPVGESRKGVPQGRHVHALLARGLEIVEGYFPGLTEHLIGLGADYGDISQKVYWFFEGGQHRVGVSGVNAISVSRPLLEGSIRQRVLALPNVEAIEGCDALGLLATPDNGRVTGVRLIRRKAGSAEESLTADLVVDASGRGPRPRKLRALFLAPQIKGVIGQGLAGRVYGRQPFPIRVVINAQQNHAGRFGRGQLAAVYQAPTGGQV